MKNMRIISIGIAIFAMLFGAGNVVFPLGLGRETGSNVAFAIIGLAITGILVPLIGLISATLFDGDYKRFLAMTGRVPGMLVALVCMLLLGPFGATPRCITLAYAAIKWHIPHLSLFFFSIIIAVVVFLATMKKNYVVELLGKLLGPIKLLLLFSIVILGLLATTHPAPSTFTPMASFIKGIHEGFWTLDLLATIFFSGLIVTSIKMSGQKSQKPLAPKEVLSIGIKAGALGGILLGLVYTGFCLLAAKYGTSVANIPQDQLLSALATLVLGPAASILANVTVATACLTTAMALTAVFADYLTHEIFMGKLNYHHALALTVATTFGMTNLGFTGIKLIIEPVAVLCYPALVALSIANMAHALWGFRYVKSVTLMTFIATVALKFV